MNDFHFFIDVSSGKALSKSSKKAFSKVLSIYHDSSMRITWIYKKRRLSLFDVSSIIFTERRLCDRREMAINNTIQFEDIKFISASAIRVLKDFNFKVILPETTDENLKNKLNKKQIDIIEICNKYHITTEYFAEWLKSNVKWRHEPFSDFVRMSLKLEPTSCKYTSCLGKTIYIDKLGKIYSCPFKPNRVELRDIDQCKTIQDIFNSEGYTTILRNVIERRNNCLNKCSKAAFCLGGCPLEDGGCPEINLCDFVDVANTYKIEMGNTSPAIRREFINLLAQSLKV